MLEVRDYEFWFLTGSQHLYGKEALDEVENNSKTIAQGLDSNQNIPYKIVFKSVLTNSTDIRKIIMEANSDENCAGIITWMHTFSPAKMWISGLAALQKPLLHFGTQFNRDIPWQEIDMDFMNLNQSAHAIASMVSWPPEWTSPEKWSLDIGKRTK